MWFSKISAELVIAMGMMGQPVFSAIFMLPSLKGIMVSERFLVPSGKMQMEIPFLIYSIPCRIVFSPCLISSRSRNRQYKAFIQSRSSG